MSTFNEKGVNAAYPLPKPEPNPTIGASIRLSNLAYYCAETVDKMNDELRAAVEYFQSDCEDLEVNGELNEETCERLRVVHDEFS
jgi:hypothetical protein